MMLLIIWMLPMLVQNAEVPCNSHWISEFIVDYSAWRKWDTEVIFVSKSAVCSHAQAAEISKLLSRSSIFSSVLFTAAHQLTSSLFIPKHVVGAVLLALGSIDTTEITEFFKQVSQRMLFNTYISWLIITDVRVQLNNFTLHDYFNNLKIRLDSDIVICSALCSQMVRFDHSYKQTFNDFSVVNVGNNEENNDKECKIRKVTANNYTCKTDQGSKFAIESIQVKKGKKKKEGICNKKYDILTFSLFEVYKIKSKDNKSLVINDLGSWDPINELSNITLPTYVEQRTDFQGYPLTVGIKNITGTYPNGEINGYRDTLNVAATKTLEDEEDDNSSEASLMQVLQYVTQNLNASYELVTYSKLGWKNDEKVWMFLLGDVVQGSLDLGLDDVTITAERASDMFFSHPLVKSMKNIYFKSPDSGAMRDIFLAPFSSHLILCVAATGVVLVVAVVIVNVSTPDYAEGKENSNNKWRIGEAIIWIISVLCMQGSSWYPQSPSGSMLLISGLCFALVTYNAYAAFITSVLSVHATPIKDLNDLLQSSFDFGYLLGGQDEIFLRTVNDTVLRQLYFRGLVQNHGVNDAVTGLFQVTRGNYAFFVSSHIARHILERVIPHDKRCDIQELSIPDTRSVVALPMSWTSPYRRVINLSLLRIREAGVLSHIRDNILLPMRHCETYSSFNSARLSDVYSAFLLLGIGIIAALLFGITEIVWRQKIFLSKCCKPNKEVHEDITGAKKKLTHIDWQN